VNGGLSENIAPYPTQMNGVSSFCSAKGLAKLLWAWPSYCGELRHSIAILVAFTDTLILDCFRPTNGVLGAAPAWFFAPAIFWLR
jgi:hypothetical protein